MGRRMGACERHIPDFMGLALARTESREVMNPGVSVEIERLVREHARLVFRIAYSVLRNHADAEDAVQEVFLRVTRHGAKNIADPKAWVARIAWRVAVHRYRSGGCGKDEEFDEQIHAASARFTDIENAVISRQQLALLDRMIATLPRKEREALLLTSIEELTSSQAAQVLGTSETSVRARVFRARQKLVAKLQKIAGAGYGHRR
jgi:RNA polymerase sigma-70 factor (ECF subfamily)